MTDDVLSVVRDPKRLTTLRELGLLDSPAEEAFDRLARLASRLLHAPIALVTLVDADRQFFKSCLGLPEPWSSWRETPLSYSFCQHTVAAHKPLVISDARDHPLVRDNPAIRDLNVVAYLGIPLTMRNGETIGSFCIIDSTPRTWAQEEIDTMHELATSVISEITLRALQHTLEAQVEERTAELERANKELEASNAQARTGKAQISEMLERITDGFVALDREWRYTYINRRGAEFFGRKPEELLGKHIWTEFPEGVGQPFQLAYERAMAEQAPLQIEEYYSPWDRWFENRIYPSPEGISIFYQEITERKRTEATLKENEERLRLALNAGHMGIFDWNLVSDVIVWTEEHAQLFGMRLEDFEGRYKSFAQRVHQDDLARINQALEDARRSHRLFHQEFRVVWPNGSLHWIASQGEFFYGAAGQALRMTGVVMNIDARKRMEVMLSGEKMGLEMIAQGTPLTETLETITRNVESLANDTLCSILLLDADGLHLRHGAAPSLPAEYNRAIDGEKIGPKAGSCGTSAYLNKPVIVTDIATDPLWADYRALALLHGLRACWSTPIESTEGKILGTFALYYHEPRSPGPADFELIERSTHLAGIAIERKRTEEALQQLTQQLEKRVAERTADLEAFTYMAAHDLRAPLRGMQGMATILLEDYGDKLDATGKHYAQRIIMASERLDHLINDLLAYSRVGRESIKATRIELDSAVKEAWSQLSAAWIDKDVIIEVTKPLSAVYGHQTILIQVLNNLFANAIKFVAPSVTPKIKVYTEQRNGGVRLWVEDNGIGIQPEYQERIFGIFERLHSGDAYPGTGIGLAIVRKGIERMDGKVGVESKFGEGSRFWIELPRAD